MENTNQKRIFISALEHSAENHCANLIQTIRETDSTESANEICWAGFGGERMAGLGCELLDNTVKRAAMIYNVFGQLGYYRKLIKQANRYFKQNTVDLVIVCDSPAFNFHIAKAAKKHGIPVLFYVAPQLWAWAPWRIHKLKRCCDKLACLLPFEKDWFRKRGVDAEFVSNPLFDEMDINLEQNYRSHSHYNVKTPKIALLPGSRDAEIKSLWPAMLDTAAALKKKHPGAVFTTCGADNEKLELMQTLAADYADNGVEVHYETNKVIDLTKESDLALVASGSATLQVAAAGCPMVIMYQSNKWMWHLLGRWLIRIRFLSLVNILAGKEQVPEFMPYFDSIEPIIEISNALLSNPSKLNQTSQALIELVRPLTERRACEVVAGIVKDMLATD
ncbi:MAG: lipid-A-disaccharide synthase [Planctomycetota bacterium]|jgi:lipid-A-disaccharide synthase